jgi:hypothetical protein
MLRRSARGDQVAQRGMRASGRNPGAGVVEAEEQGFVEQFVAHPAVESFTEAVLHRAPGAMKCQATTCCSAQVSIALQVKRPNLKAECAMVDAWNAANKIGAAVTYRKDNDKAILTKTSSLAEMLSGHTAVIWLDDIRGCVALSRVNAIEMAGV